MVNIMSNIMQNARFIGGVNNAVAAAGDSLATATPLTAAVNVITSATGTTADGVRLPADYAVGDMLVVINTTGVAVDVWPPSGGAINGASANAAKALAINMSGLYISLGGGKWGAVLSA
jgi:hypothetical protein